jgi:hypothetical protein
MTAMIPIRIVTVMSTGKRFILLSTSWDGKVKCKGEVLRRNGLSAVHARNRLFLEDSVKISEVDLTEQLLDELVREAAS